MKTLLQEKDCLIIMQFPKMEICKRYDLNCVKVLEKEYENLNEYQLVLMLKITDPFSNAVSHMSKKVIASIFGRIITI